MVINSSCLNGKKELAILEQTATGKKSTNPLMANSLPKTIMPTKLKPNVKVEHIRYVGSVMGGLEKPKPHMLLLYIPLFTDDYRKPFVEFTVNLFLPLALPFHKKRCCPPEFNIGNIFFIAIHRLNHHLVLPWYVGSVMGGLEKQGDRVFKGDKN
ncbi:hypothetical protein Tco_0327541 [Tanacetum coccineum]